MNTLSVGTDAHVVFHLWDSGGETLMIQAGAGKPCYTSRYTNQNLPASLPGGEDAAQALVERLWPLLEEEHQKPPTVSRETLKACTDFNLR